MARPYGTGALYVKAGAWYGVQEGGRLLQRKRPGGLTQCLAGVRVLPRFPAPPGCRDPRLSARPALPADPSGLPPARGTTAAA
jgi:hypothetical protein